MADLRTDEPSSLSTVHLLPCSIEYNGTAPVKSFFHISRAGDNTLRSHLRGRELKGRELEINSSYSRDIAEKSKNDGAAAATITATTATAAGTGGLVGLCIGDKGNKSWVVEGHFSTINVWEHDSLPDLSHIDDCLSWFSIADSVRTLILPVSFVWSFLRA